jgi:hypothetical protein
MKHRLTALAMLLAIASALLIAPFGVSAKPRTGSVTVPVTGTIATGGTFTGAYTITKFVKTSTGGLNAVGTLSGTLTDATGTVIGTVTNQAVTMPVTAASSGGAAMAAQAAGSCTILNLTLGPLDLNLLGLMVHLDTVHLTITAQQGSGNLLGNLLCAVANLLNGGSPLGQIATLLNQILAILNGL